jgi:RHS repeat-associated protein
LVTTSVVSTSTTVQTSRVLGVKHFEIGNHLGNVINVVTDRKIAVQDQTDPTKVAYFEAEIIMQADYYPFGMEMSGRTDAAQSDKYEFGYNGMRKDNDVSGEGNAYTTEFRQYDSRLGRWLSLDPLMDQFPWMSPFVGFDNNPILYIDPYGLESTNPDGDGDKNPTYHTEGGPRPENPCDGDTHTDENGTTRTAKDGKWGNVVLKEAKVVVPKKKPVVPNEVEKSDNNKNVLDKLPNKVENILVDVSINNPKIKDVVFLQNSSWEISKKYLDLQKQIEESEKEVIKLRKLMYAVIDGKNIHTDDGAYRKNTKLAQRTTGGGKGAGSADGDIGYRIGKSLDDYRKYEKPLRQQETKLKQLKSQLLILKIEIVKNNNLKK